MDTICVSLDLRDDTPIQINRNEYRIRSNVKAYRLEEDIRHSLATDPENTFRFDRTWNGNYVWQYYRMCHGLTLGHREEKCHHSSNFKLFSST